MDVGARRLRQARHRRGLPLCGLHSPASGAFQRLRHHGEQEVLRRAPLPGRRVRRRHVHPLFLLSPVMVGSPHAVPRAGRHLCDGPAHGQPRALFLVQGIRLLEDTCLQLHDLRFACVRAHLVSARCLRVPVGRDLPSVRPHLHLHHSAPPQPAAPREPYAELTVDGALIQGREGNLIRAVPCPSLLYMRSFPRKTVIKPYS